MTELHRLKQVAAIHRAWWVVLTQASLERRCAADLRDRGFEVWFPERLVQYKAKHMRVPSERKYPTFPGYIFARPTGEVPIWQWTREPHEPCVKMKVGASPRDAHWCEMDGADGFRGLLRNDFRPVTIGDLGMEKVRQHLEEIENTPVPIHIWRKNDVARVTKGPFASFNAEVVSDEVRGIVRVLIHIFGRSSPILLAVEQLERVVDEAGLRSAASA